MNAAELIKILQTYPPETTVYANHRDGENEGLMPPVVSVIEDEGPGHPSFIIITTERS